MDDNNWGISPDDLSNQMQILAQWMQQAGNQQQMQQGWGTGNQQQLGNQQQMVPYQPQNAMKGAMKGARKSGGFANSELGEDPIYIALSTAMENVSAEELVSKEEGFHNPETLKRRLAKYFRAAVKGLDFSVPAQQVVNEFADNALGNVSWALHGTKWIQKADFTLVLEISIGELFPAEFKAQHPGHGLEDIILKAHDRALEEALFAPVLLDTVTEIVEGKKAKNKVNNAMEAVRRELVAKINASQDDTADFFSAFENGVQDKIQEFVAGWIRGTLHKLGGEWPDAVLDRQMCTSLFQRLVVKEDVCLPRSLVRYMVEPLPENWDFVTNTINEIYDAAEAREDNPSTKKQKTSYKDYDGPNWTYKTEVCRNIKNTGYCKMGDWCVFAHDEAELVVHRSGLVGPGLPFGRGHPAEEGGFPAKGGKKGFGKCGKGGGSWGYDSKGGCSKGEDSWGYESKGGYSKGESWGFGKSCGKGYGKQQAEAGVWGEPASEELGNFAEEGAEKEEDQQFSGFV